MITIELSKQLRDAGLIWKPNLHDFFAVPDRGMDERIFVLSDVQANMDIQHGEPVVAFQGAPEWALDYLVISEVVWIPTEAQLRQQLESRLVYEDGPTIELTSVTGGYNCDIRIDGQVLSFSGYEASDAYAKALIYVLEQDRLKE